MSEGISSMMDCGLEVQTKQSSPPHIAFCLVFYHSSRQDTGREISSKHGVLLFPEGRWKGWESQWMGFHHESLKNKTVGRTQTMEALLVRFLRKVGQKPGGRTFCWLALCLASRLMLIKPSYSAQDSWVNNGATHSELGPSASGDNQATPPQARP